MELNFGDLVVCVHERYVPNTNKKVLVTMGYGWVYNIDFKYKLCDILTWDSKRYKLVSENCCFNTIKPYGKNITDFQRGINALKDFADYLKERE